MITIKHVLIVLTIIVFALLFVNIMWFKEGKTCLSNPMVYGAAKFSEANNASFQCVCNTYIPNAPTIYINSTHFQIGESESYGDVSNLDEISVVGGIDG